MRYIPVPMFNPIMTATKAKRGGFEIQMSSLLRKVGMLSGICHLTRDKGKLVRKLKLVGELHYTSGIRCS